MKHRQTFLVLFVLSLAVNTAHAQLRVGIHVGPVVAGMVGRDKFVFDLWGDTVNVAARLSSLGSTIAVYLSREAWMRVDGRCSGRPLGPVLLKGKGEIDVHRCDEIKA